MGTMNMLKDYASIAHAAVRCDAAFGSTAFLSLLNNTHLQLREEEKLPRHINIWTKLENSDFILFIYFSLDFDQLLNHQSVKYIENNQYTCRPIWIKYARMWFNSIQFSSLLKLYYTLTVYGWNSIIIYSFMKLNFLHKI